jgi:hypothetical protein
MTLGLRQIGGVLALTCFVAICATAAQAGCRSICISERHWTQLVAEHKIDVYWGPSVGPAKCGGECAGGACKDGARNYGRCGRVCGEKGEYACYGQKRGWNYSWRLP